MDDDRTDHTVVTVKCECQAGSVVGQLYSDTVRPSAVKVLSMLQYILLAVSSSKFSRVSAEADRPLFCYDGFALRMSF
jgi:TRAP-type mannitol/chloroaromatic compound transport system permease large subunit